MPDMAGIGAAGGGAKTLDSLKAEYKDFVNPKMKIIIGGEEVNTKDLQVAVGDMHIELSSTFEASIASFRIYGAFDHENGYLYTAVQNYAAMGKTIQIELGYGTKLSRVFAGYICSVSFCYENQNQPYMELTAMDVKGVLMGGCYSRQITEAKNYTEAVKKVLERYDFSKEEKGAVTKITVEDTPDARGAANNQNESSPLSREMVSESDYEFLVRVAKRYNYEFFVDRGEILFRPAKKDKNSKLQLGPESMMSFHIGYSLTSLVATIEARAMDVGKGEVIAKSASLNTQYSMQGDASKLVGKGSRVYVDPSITSEDEAENRVASLMEKMSYRLGSLDGETVGLPELLPGQFIDIKGLGKPADNTFYITKVIHDFAQHSGFKTRFEGCACTLKK